MEITIRDKFGVDREINFKKQNNGIEDYLELSVFCENDFNCCFDLDIKEIEKLLEIIKHL